MIWSFLKVATIVVCHWDLWDPNTSMNVCFWNYKIRIQMSLRMYVGWQGYQVKQKKILICTFGFWSCQPSKSNPIFRMLAKYLSFPFVKRYALKEEGKYFTLSTLCLKIFSVEDLFKLMDRIILLLNSLS